MKRLMMLLLVALAIPATAFAGISSSGGSTSIAGGQATLISTGAVWPAVGSFSTVNFDDLNGKPLANLTELSADVVSATNWGGGSPRFQVEVSNSSTTQNIMVYLGDGPNFTAGSTGQTGNLLGADARVDSSQVGGSWYGTWADAKAAGAAAGYTTISGISLVVDGGWSGPQTFVFDSVSINGTVNPFSPVCHATGFYRDGHELTAAKIGGDVTGTLDATGCDIGVYYAPLSTGSVKAANISGATYYGVLANAAAVNVTTSSIHDIGDTPINGNQRGVGVLYTTLDQPNDVKYQNGDKSFVKTGQAATGTLSGNTIAAYQKTGIGVNGPGASVTVQDNTVTGLGSVGFIAQNGIQISRGASSLVTGNTVSGNWYTPATWTACGLILYKADGVKQKSNNLFGNQTNLCNAGRGGGNTSL
jgi:Right handed beta helix region